MVASDVADHHTGFAIFKFLSGCAARHAIYLLGTLDTNPNHPVLDKSWMAEAQGPYRYARGHTYSQTMAARDGSTPNHKIWNAPARP
jgi:hypothetical protein